ncbi:hypothetical protein I4U23_012562 [Adineta vaga]|nr:hypothetical protein I4U23_012562 [Adineta vaga]
MAQASSFKPSIQYQVCNTRTDNEISCISTIKSSEHGYISNPDNDLSEITVSSATNKKTTSGLSSPNHYPTASLTQVLSSAATPSGHVSSSTDSATLIKTQSPSSPTRNTLGSSLSIHSHPRQSINSLFPSSHRPSVFGTFASTLTVARKSSTSAFPRLSTDHGNLFSGYQGDYIRQSRQLRKARKQDIKARFEKFDLNPPATRRTRFTFIFDPSGRLSYYWTSIISLAFLYNFWIIIFRYSFHELTSKNFLIWFIFDYLCDLIYLLDIMFNFRTAYLEEGVLQTDPIKLRHYYMNTTRFYIDCLCLMPLDFLYLSFGFKSIVRCFRLVKIYRFWAFLDRTERHTNYPNLFRTIVMIHYLLAIFHWNACFIYILHTRSKLDLTRHFAFLLDDSSSNYFKALYWSITTLTLTQNQEAKPVSKEDYIFLSFQIIFALLLFATIMGHVASIVSNLGNARKEFQAKLDAVKTYMSLRRVPNNLEDRVIRWFDYLWMSHKSVDDNHVLSLLPYKLRAEIAIHVHLDTLKRVEIFQNTEAGFLNELVLRLKPVLFSPDDFICRKGEVGKEMYIVNRGKLHVMADNNKTVLATLKAGSYFGEISILNMGSGNRRTASVRSVGYSDLFCLSKEDLWEVLKEYPAVRVKLESIAVKRLEKHKKPLIQLINLKRSKSSPGLIEPSCRIPYHVSVRRLGSRVSRLSSIKESDIRTNLQMNPSNSLAMNAPLASSISVTSSLNIGPVFTNEVEHLKKYLVDLEQENLSSNSILKQKYVNIQNRLKILEKQQQDK